MTITFLLTLLLLSSLPSLGIDTLLPYLVRPDFVATLVILCLDNHDPNNVGGVQKEVWAYNAVNVSKYRMVAICEKKETVAVRISSLIGVSVLARK